MILARSSSFASSNRQDHPMASFAPTIAHGSLCALRVCRLALLAPTPLASHGRPVTAKLTGCSLVDRRHGQLDLRSAIPSCRSAAGRNVLEPARLRIFRSPARLEPVRGRSIPYSKATRLLGWGMGLSFVHLKIRIFR